MAGRNEASNTARTHSRNITGRFCKTELRLRRNTGDLLDGGRFLRREKALGLEFLGLSAADCRRSVKFRSMSKKEAVEGARVSLEGAVYQHPPCRVAATSVCFRAFPRLERYRVNFLCLQDSHDKCWFFVNAASSSASWLMVTTYAIERDCILRS